MIYVLWSYCLNTNLRKGLCTGPQIALFMTAILRLYTDNGSARGARVPNSEPVVGGEQKKRFCFCCTTKKSFICSGVFLLVEITHRSLKRVAVDLGRPIDPDLEDRFPFEAPSRSRYVGLPYSLLPHLHVRLSITHAWPATLTLSNTKGRSVSLRMKSPSLSPVTAVSGRLITQNMRGLMNTTNERAHTLSNLKAQ